MDTLNIGYDLFGGIVQEKESNMGFCCRCAFPTRGMTVLSGTSERPFTTEPHIRFLYSLSNEGTEHSMTYGTTSGWVVLILWGGMCSSVLYSCRSPSFLQIHTTFVVSLFFSCTQSTYLQRK